MRIGIDARFFGAIGKGLGRYTQKLIENLEKADKTNQYFIFFRQENFNDYIPRNKNFHKILADYRWYTFSEQINMPRLLNKYNLDLVHFPHFNVPLFYQKPFIITIHDLILLHFPTIRGTTLSPLFYRLKYAAYKIVIRSAIKRAKKIIAVSNFTREDILKSYNVAEDKISVTYEACDLTGEIKEIGKIGNIGDDIILKKYGIIKPYLLYVGNAYPHKNLEALALAFEIFNKDNGCQLVLVGKEDYFYQRLKKFAESRKIKDIIFAGFVPDGELDAVYKYSSLYVFPSLYEGFGLPPLEAMARGIPVASSDHPCMKEILQNSAYYFDASRPENIAKAIGILLNNRGLREELVKKGYEQVKKYSWKKMARETLSIYSNS